MYVRVPGVDGRYGVRRRGPAVRRLRADVRAARRAGRAHTHLPAALAGSLAPAPRDQEDRNTDPQRLPQGTAR